MALKDSLPRSKGTYRAILASCCEIHFWGQL